MKQEPQRNCFIMLGADGVFRVYYSVYHPLALQVIDAVRLSPALIQEYLRRFAHPSYPDRADKFRGVDGRNVSDEDLFDPPEEIRPKRPSDEFIIEHLRKVEERARLRKERELGPVVSEPEKGSNI
jgi:hypothetical protein